MSLTVKLDIYEGPLDLLLHLIKKNEVDIYDIPIALITDQYLAYLDVLEAMNIEVAGEFLLMAATLTQIKSKMLLPVTETEDETEEEDPRMAIVRPLLEHMKLRDAAEALERRAILDRDVFAREMSLTQLGFEDDQQELVEANLFDLIDAFRKIVSKAKEEIGLKILVETKTIQERIREIIQLLEYHRQVGFEVVYATDRTKAQLILSFLSILELARVGAIKLYQHPGTKELTLFYVKTPQVEFAENYDSGGLSGEFQ